MMRKFICGAIILAFLLPIGSLCSAKEIVLKAVTGWPANDRMSVGPFLIFQKAVNERFKDQLKIEWVGGPEVIPSFELIEAVKNGVVDIANLSVAYYEKQLPEAAVLTLSQRNHRELRQSGFFDAFNQIHQKKVNSLYYAYTTGEGLRYAIYLNKKIDRPEFAGLKLRASPAYVPFLRALGAAPAVIPPADIYTALERGTIDGICWPNMGITDMGWQEVVKYMIDHEYWKGASVMLFNLNAWNKLPEPLRKELSEMSTKLEDDFADFNVKLREEYRQAYKSAGIQFIQFSPDDAKKYLDTIYETTKEDFLKKNPEGGAKLLDLVKK
jgi:TRAP-type transport system periplasmic protein